MIGIVNKANRKSQNYTNCNLNKINQIMRKIGTNKNKSKEVLKSDK